ncbi:MAG: hypothetical protein ACR2H3_08360 [Acidimicrobiales bacterium]
MSQNAAGVSRRTRAGLVSVGAAVGFAAALVAVGFAPAATRLTRGVLGDSPPAAQAGRLAEVASEPLVRVFAPPARQVVGEPIAANEPPGERSRAVLTAALGVVFERPSAASLVLNANLVAAPWNDSSAPADTEPSGWASGPGDEEPATAKDKPAKDKPAKGAHPPGSDAKAEGTGKQKDAKQNEAKQKDQNKQDKQGDAKAKRDKRPAPGR